MSKVFISYSSQDEAQAQSLASRLETSGIQPVLDQDIRDMWKARSRARDAPLNTILEEQLADCTAFVIFVDQASQWQQRELRAAMGRHWESEEFRIVPIAATLDDVPNALARFESVVIGSDTADEVWQNEVLQALGTPPESAPRTGPAEWSEEDQSKYRERLERILQLAKDDEAQREREYEPWQRST